MPRTLCQAPASSGAWSATACAARSNGSIVVESGATTAPLSLRRWQERQEGAVPPPLSLRPGGVAVVSPLLRGSRLEVVPRCSHDAHAP
ncbi:hypothetical protein MRX96_003778 [Rhipicephalus microplus]